jgi:hypothetical protein
MKIKNNSGLLLSTTFTTIHDTKLTKQQTTVDAIPQKPRRQTAAQRRAALLAQKTIIAKDSAEQESSPSVTFITTTDISAPSSPPPSSVVSTKDDHPAASNQHHETTLIPTPPVSPSFDSPPSVASLEANARILAVKRDGNLKAVMVEFTTMKKQGLTLTHHTYNLVLDAYATLRREGSPLAPMLRGKTKCLRVVYFGY